MKKFISVLLCVILVICSLSVAAFAQGDNKLRFGKDGKFTVLQITDPQDDAAIAHGLIEFIEEAIDLTQPDFIVITGDLVEDSRLGDISSDDEILREGVKVSGNYEKTLANVKSAVAQIFAPLEESGIPYAVTLGNNDYNSSVTTEDWLEIFAEYPNCMTVDMSDDKEGKIDTRLEVLSSKTNKAAYYLWLLDNGKSFNEEQLSWMKDSQTNGAPGVVFAHVPTDDIGNLFEECKPYDEGALADGADVYRLNDEIAGGHAEEAFTPGASSEEFGIWKDKNVKSAFFGHLHTSGFTGTYDGITMGLTYGCQFAKAGPYGMRTIELDEASGEMTTKLFTYSDGQFSIQRNKAYAEINDDFTGFIAKMRNFMQFIINSLTYLMKF